MILLLFAALFVTGPVFPSGETPGCLILTKEMMQVRPCTPDEDRGAHSINLGRTR